MQKKKGRLIDVMNDSDVDQINLITVLNCGKNVFFNEETSEEYIQTLYNKSLLFERPNKIIAQQFIKKKQVGEEHLNLVTFTSTKINLSLSFIKLTSVAKAFRFDDRLSLPRETVRPTPRCNGG